MKRLKNALILCALLLSAALCLTACKTDSKSSKDYSNQTVTGQVTAIEENNVTLTLGELSTASESSDDQNSKNGTPPDMPGESMSKTDNETQSDNSGAQGSPAIPQSDGASDLSRPDGAEGDMSSPPEKPDDQDASSGEGASGAPMGDPPEANNKTFTASDETLTLDLSSASITKDNEAVTLSDISVGDILTVTFGDKNSVASVTVENTSGGSPDGAGAPGGTTGSNSGTVTSGSSANTISENGSYSDTSYSSTGDDENALRIDGAEVTLSNITVTKSAGATSNTENGDFYGVNAALLALNGANVTITGATVNSSAQNGNGVFSYGSGTTVNISDSTITTTSDNSGGIQTTGGGTTNASNLTVNTSGNSSAAIRSDRGGGTVTVKGGSYTSNGYNSPAIYSTAEITVNDAELTANNSEALVIEGKNSITLKDCTVTGNMSDTKSTSADENVHNVMIYQSMSGDADVGTSTLSISGGSLTGKSGDMFYITNTHCLLTLTDVEITNEDSDGYLIRVSGNSASHGWGTAGSNGAQVELTADNQTLNGNIIVDSISTLSLSLTNGSTLTGTVNIIDNAENGSAVSNNAVITIESGCTFNLTGNCTVTSIVNNGTINFNGYTITLADGTVLG